MFRKVGLPVIAVLGVVFGIVMYFVSGKKPPQPQVAFPPPKPPYTHFIAAKGVVESSSEDIYIGSPFDEVVESIFVTPGQTVAAGDPLFALDTRALRAKRNEAEARKNTQMAHYTKLLHQPRKEEVPPAFFRMEAAKAEYESEEEQYEIVMRICDRRAISQNELNIRKNALNAAKARYDEAKSDLELLTSGAWIRDIEIQKTELLEADRAIERIDTDIERSIVRAPTEGQVLQINLRQGEKTADIARENPLMVFGSTNPMYMRIEIDQDEAWRFTEGSPATAFVRGNSDISFPLTFLRIDPYIIPKQALTGDPVERIDTRVLRVLYTFDKKQLPVYVGQITDVYIQSKPYPQ